MSKISHRLPGVGLTALVLLATACADGGTDRITIGGFNFAESAILSHIYAGALSSEGVDTEVRANLGSREVVAPALEKGDIDAYIGYAATDLEFWNNNAGQATADAQETVSRLDAVLRPKGLAALTPSPAADQNAFGVTQATADRLRLRRTSDLAPVGSQLTLGGPAECPTRPFCQAGLEQTYGIRFKAFRALDAGGPLTKAALRNGDIDVGLLFTSDASGFVLLEDDRKLQKADAVVPIVRGDRADTEARNVMDRVSARLTTQALQEMNDRVNVGKEDPEAVARTWLSQNGFARK